MGQLKIKDVVDRTFCCKSLVSIISAKFHELKRLIYSLLLRFIAVLCIIIFTIWGLKEVWNSLIDQDVFKVSPATFTFQTPPWIKERFAEDIKHVETLRDYYGMYEKDLTRTIAGIYKDIVLVKKVEAVKRIFPNTLKIKFIIRRPIAVIKNRDSTYLVDDESVLLPKEYYKLSDVDYTTPYVESNRFTRLPLYGEKWDDKKIKAGIELIKFLRANNVHKLFKIVSVNVSNVHKAPYTGKSDIVLWTENSTQIRWGCSSLYKRPDALSDEEKLQNLLSVAKSEGTNLQRMEYVDVRWEKPVGKKWDH